MEERNVDLTWDVKINCRICFQSCSDMCSLFSEEKEVGHWEMLSVCGRVDVQESDGLPTVICQPCLQEMLQAYRFVTKCQDTDRKLRLALISRDTKDKEENSINIKTDLDNVIEAIKYEVQDDEVEMLEACEFHLYQNMKSEECFTSINSQLNIEISTHNTKMKRRKKNKKKKHYKMTQASVNMKRKHYKMTEASVNMKKKHYKMTEASVNMKKKHYKMTEVSVNMKSHSNFKLSTNKRKNHKYDGEFPKKCSQCPLILKCRSTMLNHLLTHTNEYPFECDHCGKHSRTKGTLKAHIIRFHLENGIRRFICKECNKCFYRKPDLVVHLRTHSGETPYACKFCPRAFTQSGGLLRHLRASHTGDKPYKCPHCPVACFTSSELDKHKTKHSNERPFPCPDCGQSYKTKAILNHHMILHNNPKAYVCHQCGTSFNSRGNLSSHVKRVHSEKAGLCLVCNKEFIRLADHMRTHTGETPFQCNTCNKKYSLKQSLIIHMRKHIDLSKFACEYEGCNSTFKYKAMLDFHVSKYHRKQPTYVCRYCNRGFFRLSDIKRHTDMTHTDKQLVSSEDLRKSKLY